MSRAPCNEHDPMMKALRCTWSRILFLSHRIQEAHGVGRRRGMVTDEHIAVGSNSYEKVKIIKYLGSLLMV